MTSDGSDDEDYAFYGTPLDPIEEDAIPSKKPTPIEEQEVRDKNGRRRFHGAFTGGFSAGYCNSVGSEEGWTPSSFKSSRSEKSSQKFQKPEDFMDEEDKSEFGFAPKVLRATSDYNQSSSRKRPHISYTTGPIPGQPVLRDVLQPVKDTVGVRLLRRMGWRPGQGVGPRLKWRQKKVQQKEIKKASRKVYGCQLLPGSSSAQSAGSGEDSSEESDNEATSSVTFAPDDYDAFIVKIKDDVFGIGYKGLDKRPVLSEHVQLFEPSFLGMQEKKKKVAIWGQAFGVGALEEEDEDIYAKDDMSRYDFALESSTMVAQRKKDERAAEERGRLALGAPRGLGAPLEGFLLAKQQPNSQRKFFRPPDIPLGFKAMHEAKRSRWDVNSKGENIAKKQGLGRHDLDARVRASILDEPLPKKMDLPAVDTQPSQSKLPLQSSAQNTPIASTSEKASFASLASVTGCQSGVSTFKPFVSQPDKQARYERFLEFSKSGQKDLLASIQPSSMTEWDKEHERSEFEQSARLYKPLSGIISDRFVSALLPDDTLNPLVPVEKMKHGNEEMRNAAKMRTFGKLTRTRGSWQPNALLCKRFNVPQPFCSVQEETMSSIRSSSFSVFDFLEASSHNTRTVPMEMVPQDDIQTSNLSLQSDHQTTSVNNISLPPPAPHSTSVENEGMTSVPPKKLSSISDTLARLLADDTGEIQPEPEEKPDLFKAIFLSSSDDSGSDSENESEKTLPKQFSAETAAPRNLSPPRGIFANLDLDALSARPALKKDKIDQLDVTTSDSNRSGANSFLSHNNECDDDLMYGPRLPSALPKVHCSSSVDKVSLQPLDASSAVWVERPLKKEKSNVSSDSDESSESSNDRDKKKTSKKKKQKKHSKHKKEKKHKRHKSKSKHKKKS